MGGARYRAPNGVLIIIDIKCNQNEPKDLQEIPILWIKSGVQDEAGAAFDPHFVQHCRFYCQQCELQCNSAVWYSTSVYVHVQFWSYSTVQSEDSAQCTEWSAKALFLWDEPSSALKGLPTPKRCRWWSRWLRWPWRWFLFFRVVAKYN